MKIEGFEELVDGWYIIRNVEDWEWYKKTLDVIRRFNHDHFGGPERFPCAVHSELGENSFEEYIHQVVYREEIVCSGCGKKTAKWMDVEGII